MAELKIIVTGPPSCGKNTQAKLIKAMYSLPLITVDEAVKVEIKIGSDLGKEAQEYLDRGEPIPDEVIIDILHFRFKEKDCQAGWILVGFPDSFDQAYALSVYCNVVPNKVIILDCKEEILSGRNSRPADEYENRVIKYRSNIDDLSDFFEQFIERIDADQDKDKVFADCVEFLDKEVDVDKGKQFIAELDAIRKEMRAERQKMDSEVSQVSQYKIEELSSSSADPSKIAQLLEKAKNLEREVEEEREQTITAKEQLKEAREAIDALENELEEAKQETKKEVRRVAQDLEDAKEQIEELTRTNDKLIREVKFEKERAESADRILQNERQRLSNYEATLNETRGMSSTAEEERDAFKAKYEKAAKELRIETERADTAEKEFSDEKVKARELRRKLDDEQDKTDQLEEEIIRNKTRISKLEQELFQAKENLHEKEAELAKSDNDAGKLGKQIKSLQDQLAEAKLAHEKTQGELDRLNRTIQDIESSSGDGSDVDKHKLLKTSRDLESEREKATSANEMLKREKSRTSLLEEEMQKLNNELKRLRVSDARETVKIDNDAAKKRAEERALQDQQRAEERKAREDKIKEDARIAAERRAAQVAERAAQAAERRAVLDSRSAAAAAPRPAAEPRPAADPAAPAGEIEKCNKCNAVLRMGTKFCVKCGNRNDVAPKVPTPAGAGAAALYKTALKTSPPPAASEADVNCPKCKRKLRPGAKFCASCGQRIG